MISTKNWKVKNGDGEEAIEQTRVLSIEKSIDASPQANKIYLYSDINKDTVLNLNRQIDDLTRQLKIIQFTYDLPHPPAIELHICSDGGDIFAAMASVDKIISNTVPIDTYCEGMVASAATLLSSVGNKRYITKSSCMLVHQVTSGLWGNYMQFKDEIKNLELLMSLIKDVYLKRTKFDASTLDELLTHDLCLNSEKCLSYGLVDKIL